MRILIFVIWMFFVGVFLIIEQRDANITSFDGFATVYENSVGWALHLGSNFKTLTSNVVKMDWLPAQNILNKTS